MKKRVCGKCGEDHCNGEVELCDGCGKNLAGVPKYWWRFEKGPAFDDSPARDWSGQMLALCGDCSAPLFRGMREKILNGNG